MAILSGSRRRLTEGDLKLMGIPKRYWPDQGDGNGILFDTISDGRHKEAARNYMRKLPEMIDKGYGIYLHGDSGVGKTAIAALIAHEARRYDAIVSFFSAYELRDAVSQKVIWEDSSTITDRAKGVDLLIIDDLGKEIGLSGKYSKKDTFYEQLIKIRNDHLRSTIITSNFCLEDLADRYGQGLRNVMQGCIYAIKVDGRNFYEGRDVVIEKAICL